MKLEDSRWVFFLQVLSLLSPVIRPELLKRPEVALEDLIPPGYDSVQTPIDNGKPVDVSIQIVILNIRSVDVSEMSYIADIFLHETWKDSRLRYPANTKLEKISLHTGWTQHIWTPDIYFYNAIEGKVLTTVIPYMFLWLKNDSTVTFGVRLSLEFSCDMLLHKFPHDTQTCDIIVKSLTHTLSEMNLHWDEQNAITLGDCIILPQFELNSPNRSTCNESNEFEKHGGAGWSFAVMAASATFPVTGTETISIIEITSLVNDFKSTLATLADNADIQTIVISLGGVLSDYKYDLALVRGTAMLWLLSLMSLRTFACLRGVIQLTRRSGYYIINIYIPTILIVFMSMLTFWIPVDAVPGRVTLGVTSLLTIITKQYQASLPSVSYVIALNVWLSLCIGFVFCGLLEYSGVIALQSHQKRLEANALKANKGASWRNQPGLINRMYLRVEKIDVTIIDRVCRVLFPLVYIIICVIYVFIYM